MFCKYWVEFLYIVWCFDNTVLCFDNIVLRFDNSLLCFDNTVLYLEKCLLCFRNCLLYLQIWPPYWPDRSFNQWQRVLYPKFIKYYDYIMHSFWAKYSVSGLIFDKNKEHPKLPTAARQNLRLKLSLRNIFKNMTNILKFTWQPGG